MEIKFCLSIYKRLLAMTNSNNKGFSQRDAFGEPIALFGIYIQWAKALCCQKKRNSKNRLLRHCLAMTSW